MLFLHTRGATMRVEKKLAFAVFGLFLAFFFQTLSQLRKTLKK